MKTKTLNIVVVVLALLVAFITLNQYIPSVTASKTLYSNLNVLGNTTGCGSAGNCSTSCLPGWNCVGSAPGGCGGNCTLNTTGCGPDPRCQVTCPGGYQCRHISGNPCGGTCVLNTTSACGKNTLCNTCPGGQVCVGDSSGFCNGNCQLNTTGCGAGLGCQPCGPFRICVGARPSGCGGACVFVFPPFNTTNSTVNASRVNGTILINSTNASLPIVIGTGGE